MGVLGRGGKKNPVCLPGPIYAIMNGIVYGGEGN